jgi:hypothetical protein
MTKHGLSLHHSGLASPWGRPPGLVWGPLTIRRLVLLSTIYSVDSKAVLGRFIQRWSREMTQIYDVALPWLLLHLPPI